MAAAAGMGMFLAALDISLNVALPSITTDFDTDLQTVQWIIVVYIATRAGLVMGAGSFADRFGLKPVYLFGAATYLVSMFLFAFSPNLETMVGFRVLQALGTGCLFAVSPAVAARVFPVHRRGLGMGLTAASQALGMLAGTIGAGMLLRVFEWEAVFLARAPFALLALLLAVKFMGREDRSDSESSFDLNGAVTLIGVMLCLVIGLRLGRSVGWTAPEVLVLLSLTPVLLAGFWRAEGRAQWPVVPRDMFRARAFVVSVLSMFLAHLGVFVIWFIFPFYISDGLGRGPFTLGVMLAVMASLNTGFSGAGGWLCDRIGTLPVGFLGLVITAGGLVYMSFLDASSGLSQVGFRISVVGIRPGTLSGRGLHPNVGERFLETLWHSVGGIILRTSFRHRIVGGCRGRPIRVKQRAPSRQPGCRGPAGGGTGSDSVYWSFPGRFPAGSGYSRGGSGDFLAELA